MLRLQKFIADAGITSRRKAEILISEGKVAVNGKVIRELGTKVCPESDAVIVEGNPISLDNVHKHYIVLHKPRGVMTTLDDPQGRQTVIDLLKEIPDRIYPVGRLDYLSEGLLVLTNDGQMAQDIIHPSKNVIKVYEVKVFGAVNAQLLKALRNGVQSEVGLLKPKSVRVIGQLPTKTWLEFRLEEGRNREIRRICEKLGLTIDKLKRVAIGGLSLDNIAPGNFRYLSKRELTRAIGLDKVEPIEYFSRKKSVNLKKKSIPDTKPADHPSFVGLRKENYFETLKAREEKHKRLEKEKRTAEYLEKEARHQERLQKKAKRRLEKQNAKKSVHAVLVK